MKYTPRKYQSYTSDKIVHSEALAAFLGLGLGKTVSSLTAIEELIYDRLNEENVLVISPKKVTESVWPDEMSKWDHLKHLTYSVVLGTEKQRKMALQKKAQVYLINRENVPWLVSQYQSAWPFRFVIIDESSSFKAHDSARFKAMKMVRPYIKRIVLLTGTPAPNSLMDLWPQIYLLDRGQRLGNTITKYRDRFFYHVGFKWLPKPGAEEAIHALIKDICISMSSEDYLELPGKIDNVIRVRMDERDRRKYEEFERARVLEIMDEDNITAVNAAVLTNKLLQYANGAIYDESKQWHPIHSAKLEAIQEAVEALEGEPVLIAYSFQHDKERLKMALKSFKPRTLDGPEVVREWNEGKIKVLLLHPASAGHGLNLQFGGHHIFWFGHTWSSELDQQLNGRLDRPGQKFPVVITRFIVEGTIDEDVKPALDAKKTQEQALINAVKVRIDKYRK